MEAQDRMITPLYVIFNEEELQQDTQGGDSLEKEETDAESRLMRFRTGRVQILEDTQAAKSVTASGAVADNVTWTLYEDGELAISGTTVWYASLL